MKLSILKVQAAQPEEWDIIWKQCEYATYYQSREWAEIWEKNSQRPFQSKPELISFSDRKQALLPIALFRKYNGLVKEYISSYAVTFGGWISRDSLEVEHSILLRRHLTNKIRTSLTDRLIWRMNPYDDLSLKSTSAFSAEDTTFGVDLTLGFDTILKNSSKSHRKNYRKAKKNRLTVKVASTLDDWRQYYDQVYLNSVARWGKNTLGVVKWDTFQYMFDLDSPYIKLWISCYDGRIIAGGLRFYSKKIIVGWQATSHDEYLYLNPHTLLNYKIIEDSCDKGYQWFDLGPSAGLKSVSDFKRKFGAIELHCPLIVVNNKLKAKILLRDLLSLVKIKIGGPGLSVCD